MIRHFSAGLLAGLCLTGPAFAQEPAAAPVEGAVPGAEVAAPQAADPATVLARVNGVDITLGHAIVMLEQLPAQYRQLPDEVLMQGLVDQLVDQTLLAAEASAGPDSDPLQVRLQLENERRGLLASQVVQERIGAPLGDDEVQAAYDAEVAGFEPAKEFRAAHILVASEEEAARLHAEIEGGADFAELAKAHSTDPGSGAQGGELGWFGPGQMVPEFEAAAAALEPGGLSAPVQSQFGWHLVKLEETRDSTPPTLDELRPQIEATLRQQKLEAEIAALRGAATIETVEGAVAPSALRAADPFGN